VATGADLTGRISLSGNCSDWTTGNLYGTGTPAASGILWVDSGAVACTNLSHLYCFGVGMSSPLEVTPASGRLAFVTVQSYTPTMGLAGADMLCAAEAAAAHLPGTFRALLGSSTASAISRFDVSGPTWVRTDGIPLADSALAFANGDLTASPSLTALGTPASTDRAMTGGDISVPSMDTCTDWSGGSGTRNGGVFYASNAAFNVTTSGCSGGPIYCLAE
jgi:hypothetical protein